MNQQNQKITKRVLEVAENVWEKTYSSAQKVLGAINNNGYNYNLVNGCVTPSVDQIIVILKTMLVRLDSLSNLTPVFVSHEQSYEIEKALINSKQVVLQLESIMVAMSNNDLDECDKLFKLLEQQQF
ncbi:hypothetical protein ADP71_40470 [Vitreoscilla sp. C1]|uniref:hypothetical protein n=1 Tax=Vitreoscilla sp. (strain C1) TaxID=96942 RepID=UPI00148EC04F|nr:hypothetical protein [Vitreoscilla sp. C1]QJQ52277.1 hypothetical protein ADP71_40470 [Vitreoscilla sp. C1]